MGLQSHLVPPTVLAYGVAGLPAKPGRVEMFARDELAEHIRVLCRTVHGPGVPALCAACRAVPATNGTGMRAAITPVRAASTTTSEET